MAEEKQEDSFSLSEDAPRPVPLVATAASTVANAATAFNDATDRLSQLEKDTLISILVVNMDYILTKNSIDASFQVLKGNPLQPVIRIFGSTSNGQRACLHLHGVRI